MDVLVEYAFRGALARDRIEVKGLFGTFLPDTHAVRMSVSSAGALGSWNGGARGVLGGRSSLWAWLESLSSCCRTRSFVMRVFSYTVITIFANVSIDGH